MNQEIEQGSKVTWNGQDGQVIYLWKENGVRYARVKLKGTSFIVTARLGELTLKPKRSSGRKKHIPM